MIFRRLLSQGLLGVLMAGASSLTGVAFAEENKAGCSLTAEDGKRLMAEALAKRKPSAALGRANGIAAMATQLPRSVDLQGVFPPPGDQGSIGSCTAWAIAYASMSEYWGGKIGNWNLLDTGRQFSPLWLYNQLPKASNGGTSPIDALNLVSQKGCDTLWNFNPPPDTWVNTGGGWVHLYPDPTTVMPDQSSFQRALRYRAGYTPIYTIANNSKNDLAGIKSALNAGKGVMMSVSIRPDFDNLSYYNMIYDDISGSVRGAHEICLIGYDDDKGIFKFINSWGQTRWGLNGYGYAAYGLVENTQIFWLPFCFTDDLYLSGSVASGVNDGMGSNYATVEFSNGSTSAGTYELCAHGSVVLKPGVVISGNNATCWIHNN